MLHRLKLSLRISDDVMIRNGIQACEKIHRRQSVHIRRLHMEDFLVDAIIPDLQTFHHISKEPFLTLKLRHLALIHLHLSLQTTFGIRTEKQGEDHIIKHGHGHGSDDEHQAPAEPLPQRGPHLTEAHLILVICVFACHYFFFFFW